MLLTETIGNNVCRYPLLLLIFGPAGIFVLAFAHSYLGGDKYIFLRLRLPFYFCLTFLICQYMLAIIGLHAAQLSILANALVVIVNLWLLVIWAQSIRKYIDKRKVKAIRFIAYGWQLLFILSSAATLPGAIHIDYSLIVFNDNCDNCTFIDVTLIIWRITLGIAIAANLSQVCLTLMLRCFLDLKEHPDKRMVHSQLVYLFISSLLLASNHFGILFEVPILYFITFLLFHIVFILMWDRINHFIQEGKRQQKEQEEQTYDNIV
jgi:hypothetical protein